MSSSPSSPLAGIAPPSSSSLPTTIHQKRWPIQIEHLLGNTTSSLVLDFEHLVIIFDSIKQGQRKKKIYPIASIKAQRHETHANQLHLDIDHPPHPSKTKRLLFSDLTQRNHFHELLTLLQLYGTLPYQQFRTIHNNEKSSSSSSSAQSSHTNANSKIKTYPTLTRPIFHDEPTGLAVSTASSPATGLAVPTSPSPGLSPPSSPSLGASIATSTPSTGGTSPQAAVSRLSISAIQASQATTSPTISTSPRISSHMIPLYHQCMRSNDFAPYLQAYHEYQQDPTSERKTKTPPRSRSPSAAAPESDNPNPPEIRAQLEELVSRPGNNICADCTATKPNWASENLGTLICIKCSGVHRNLGTHISFVRSLDMDKWDPSHISAMRGNNVVNDEYEYYVTMEKPNEMSSGEQRQIYISAKYKDKAFTKEKNPEKERKAPVIAKISAEDEKSEPGMVVTSGILMITLIEGKDLAVMDLTGKSDPFVVFSNGRQTVKSKKVEKSLNPDFKRETLSLCVDSLSRPVKMEVWDADRIGADQLMGTAHIDISAMKADDELDKWCKLDTQGSIHLSLSYTFLG